jgi:4-amino-4-deoxy-L-arabinose transferase-like glycosyltransferase
MTEPQVSTTALVPVRTWLQVLRSSLPMMFWTVAVTAVVAYGAYLRFDALIGKYGPFTQPPWLVSVQQGVLATREEFVLPGWRWQKETRPYLGGDPVNYIKLAREMTWFYQGHVREPMFVATTRAFFGVVDGADVAVSLASLTYSTLAILATFLLGSAFGSRLIGLAAAFLVAVEGEFVAWAPDGWRDDAFTAMVTFAAWAALRHADRRTWMTAGLLGTAAAAAVLTRITSLSFLIPIALLLVFRDRAPDRRVHLTKTVAAMALTTLLVAPYFINCYRAAGDAFIAINAHTRYYRAAEGLPYGARMSAVSYTAGKFRSQPITYVDTALRGIFVYPFEIKFRGFAAWPAWFGPALAWLSAIGLLLWPWTARGRLALVILLTSLVPYMLTWAVPGGNEWRFTMHVYPLYLVAAVTVLARAGDLIVSLRPAVARTFITNRPAMQTLALRAGTTIALVGVALLWRYYAPALAKREQLVNGLDVSVAAASDDGIFFGEGWSPLTTSGAVTSRFATVLEPELYIPLPERRPYRMVLRIDPVPVAADDPPAPLEVLIDGVRLETVTLTLNPDRVGSYPFTIPPELGGKRLARLTLRAATLRPAGTLANTHGGLTTDMPVAFRLWLVRLSPL